MANKEVSPLKLRYTDAKEEINRYWVDLLPNSYVIIDSITDDAMLLPIDSSPPNICRDGYLFGITKWANEGKEKSILSALFTTVDSSELSDRLIHTAHMWQGVFSELKYSLHDVTFNRILYTCVVFEVTKKMAENPLTFWLLTDDLRYNCTGKHKYIPTDSMHTSSAYIDLVMRLRQAECYTQAARRSAPQCLVPSKYASDVVGGYNCRSPLEYLEHIKYVNAVLAALLINPKKYKADIRVAYHLCYQLEKIALQINSKISAGPINMSTLTWVREAHAALNRLDNPSN